MSSVPSLFLPFVVDFLGLGWSSHSVLLEGKAANLVTKATTKSVCSLQRQLSPALEIFPVFVSGSWQKQF
jgi:hypothetical protein